MKKFFVNIVFTVLTMCVLHAQDVKFGIRGGMNITNMSTAKSTPISEGYGSRVAPGWGIFTEYQYNPMLSFRFGVEYSSLGGKRSGMQAMPTERLIMDVGNSIGMGISDQQLMALGALMTILPSEYYVDVENTAKYDYFTLPLLAQTGWDIGTTPWRFYVNAGPVLSFTLSGKQIADGSSRLYHNNAGTTTLWDIIPPMIPGVMEDVKGFLTSEFRDIDKMLGEQNSFDETNTTGEMRSVNFGLAGNVGIRYQYNRNFFFMEAGGNYGFLSLQDSDANGSNRLGAITIMVGYSFSLF